MVRLIERYLIEDIDAIRNLPQFKDIPEDIFNELIRIDPTFKEGKNSVGKYGKWLLTLYKKDKNFHELFMSDQENVKNAEIISANYIIKKYDSIKNDRTKTIEKDIMKFKTLQDMYDAVDNVQEAELTSRQQSRQDKKDKDYDMVFEGDVFAVFVPKNHAGNMALASFGGSSKAKWCTAADSEEGKYNYDHYLQRGGKYYVLINKNDYNEKYQFHFETNQFLNQNNRMGDDYLIPVLEKDEKLMNFFETEGYSNDMNYTFAKQSISLRKNLRTIPKERIEGADLMSFDFFDCYVHRMEAKARESWWLKTAHGMRECVLCVYGYDGHIFQCYIDEETGVRPLLKINCWGTDLKSGEKFEFGGHVFTIARNKGYAICDDIIGKCCFNKSREDGNNYEESYVKKYVDDWFNNAFAEYNNETNVNESYRRIKMKEY